MRTKMVMAVLVSALIVPAGAMAGDNPEFRYIEPEGMILPQASFGLGVVIDPGISSRFSDRTNRRQCGRELFG